MPEPLSNHTVTTSPMAKEIIVLYPATVELTLTGENEIFYSGMNLKKYVMQRYYTYFMAYARSGAWNSFQLHIS